MWFGEAMTWVKLDDQFPDHPKIEAAGPLAAWLFVCGLCYAAEHLTDGFIPATKAPRLTTIPKPAQHIATLLRVGLWEQVDDGYRIPGYLEYQPSAAKVKAEREAARKRMAAGRSGEVPANNDGSSASPSPSPSSDVVTSPSPLTLVVDQAAKTDAVLGVIADQALASALDRGQQIGSKASYRAKCLTNARKDFGKRVGELVRDFDAPNDLLAAAAQGASVPNLNHYRRKAGA